MNKLDKIEINQYRGIKNMTLDNLSRVNVLVGENNSGKTSILEAIQLLSNPFSESLLFHIVFRRLGVVRIKSDNHIGEMLKEILKWIFPQGADGRHQPIELSLQHGDKKTPVSFELVEQEFVDVGLFMKSREDSFATTSRLPTKVEHRIGVKIANEEKVMKLSEKIPLDDESKNSLYESTHIIHGDDFRNISPEQIGIVILSLKKSELIKILKQFDNEITGIEIIPIGEDTQIYIQKNRKELMPLTSFGDGLQKIVYIASKLLNIQNGVLLLDEAEVSIHTKMIPTFFEWISKLAKQHDVTVFMTTHSIEAVDGLLAANKESLEDLSFYRLEKSGAKFLSGKRMYRIRYDFAMEVRG